MTEHELIAQRAADWIVRLSADDPGERNAARTGFEAWKQADPRHAAVAGGMERFIERTRGLRGDASVQGRAARAALARGTGVSRNRRRAGLLTLAVALLVPGALALRTGSPAEWMADLRTGAGEQREHRLEDGSRLTLGTSSAVNTRWTADLRHIELLSGEILVQVARDTGRPLVVETAHGRIRALGTRFIVRRDKDITLLTMLESRTAVSAGPATDEFTVGAGERARLSVAGVERLGGVNASATEAAFKARRLLVQDRPLSDVLDEIGRHRSGFIRYERAHIEGIRVSAVLPLDDTDRALQLLASNFPQLRVQTVTPWVVLIDATP